MEVSENIKNHLFNKMEAISTPMGDYIIFEDGNEDAHGWLHMRYAVYLFLPTDGKKVGKEDVFTSFEGIDCICWDGQNFEYFKRVKNPDFKDFTARSIDHLSWVAFDLMHLYIELAAHNIEIHEDALQRFLKKAKVI